MKIAILHFHLNTAGVTSVIRQQAAALKTLGHDVILLSGQSPQKPMDAAVEVIQGLGYYERGCAAPPVNRIVSDIRTALDRHGAWPPDLFHVHNPLLAKNHHLSAVLERLQRHGLTLLCQVHDFAEDGRPYAFFPDPYPKDCHYAVINLRDYHILKTAGLSDQGLHYLPNAVSPWPLAHQKFTSALTSVLYPVRAIRRKNIGEAILLHQCRHPQWQLRITLPPTSHRDLAAYGLWRSLVTSQGLNVLFEAGLSSDFRDLTTQCAYALTTSITEGFGFAFLEPWTGQKLLSGRILPDISEDFRNRGLQLDHLYRRFMVPLAWLDGHRYRNIWCETMDWAARQYGIELSKNQILTGWQNITSGDLVDFGLLDETSQSQVLYKTIREQTARDDLCRLNAFLYEISDISSFNDMIEHNHKVINEYYNHNRYAENLIRIYTQAITTPVKHQVDKKTVALLFLGPESFSLLKWRPFEG